MKKYSPLLLLCLLPLFIPADEQPPADERAQKVVEEKILAPLQKMQAVPQRFSRRRLMPPSCAWGLTLENGMRSFTIHTPNGAFILGLYESEGDKVFLLDTHLKMYVHVNEHPRFKNKKE